MLQLYFASSLIVVAKGKLSIVCVKLSILKSMFLIKPAQSIVRSIEIVSPKDTLWSMERPEILLVRPSLPI